MSNGAAMHPLDLGCTCSRIKNKVRQFKVAEKEDFLLMISQLNYLNDGVAKVTVDIERT